MLEKVSGQLAIHGYCLLLMHREMGWEAGREAERQENVHFMRKEWDFKAAIPVNFKIKPKSDVQSPSHSLEWLVFVSSFLPSVILQLYTMLRIFLHFLSWVLSTPPLSRYYYNSILEELTEDPKEKKKKLLESPDLGTRWTVSS